LKKVAWISFGAMGDAAKAAHLEGSMPATASGPAGIVVAIQTTARADFESRKQKRRPPVEGGRLGLVFAMMSCTLGEAKEGRPKSALQYALLFRLARPALRLLDYQCRHMPRATNMCSLCSAMPKVGRRL
jgi:hypothetical protein